MKELEELSSEEQLRALVLSSLKSLKRRLTGDLREP